jgi:hypothetical protein
VVSIADAVRGGQSFTMDLNETANLADSLTNRITARAPINETISYVDQLRTLANEHLRLAESIPYVEARAIKLRVSRVLAESVPYLEDLQTVYTSGAFIRMLSATGFTAHMTEIQAKVGVLFDEPDYKLDMNDVGSPVVEVTDAGELTVDLLEINSYSIIIGN